jgi:hypothetical protein
MLQPPSLQMRSPAIGPDGRAKFSQNNFNVGDVIRTPADQQEIVLPGCRRPAIFGEDILQLGRSVFVVQWRDRSGRGASCILYASCCDRAFPSRRLVEQHPGRTAVLLPAFTGRWVVR